ncbi:heparinase [Adhaeribacter aerolatus]|uniref:Heparinase n=1 Tax=Adhaeribacter aerolatus TaxID=670289 RepID=A0A512ASB7_9BACT|nr:heparinase II/III family protein [Adhaeribacter aerolatus]GEO02606.1 heparinase [Adhaeribacter aerolatus]
MYKTLVILLFISLCSRLGFGYEKRNLLQKKASKEQVLALVLPDKQWVKYPAYTDRAGWNQLSGKFRATQIKEAEKYLDYEWKVVKATDYLAFEKSGSRTIMEAPFGANSSALSALVLAELCEGQGRFIPQIINGVWVFSEMTSWALSAHLGAYQTSKRALPDYQEHVIDLTAGDIGSLLSWIHYFFKEPFDKVNPVIAKRLKQTLQERVLDTYMQRSDFWWQAFNLKPGGMVNNWNPWCNFNVLTCFLLIEDNPEKLAAGVHRTMASVDEFINYTKTDGACEEGPSYWGHAAGKLYDYLQLLSYATSGRISIFDQPIVKNMGEYIANSYVGDGWVVNFADASAKGGGDAGLIYRYGQAVNSQTMQHFAAYLHQKKSNTVINIGRDLFRALEELRYNAALAKTSPALPAYTTVWYPETEFCYMKNKAGFFFAGKGGFNAESHNHNDVGTFSLYLNKVPVFIDAGVGTYTRQTFSSERYTIWTMQSNYHNLPMINGTPQAFGPDYRSRSVAFDPRKQIFALDIAGSYPESAAVKRWQRSYTLTPNEGLTIQDDFELKKAKTPNQINFLVWQQPDISSSGIIRLAAGDKKVSLTYDPKQFKAQTEAIALDDKRLSQVWGDKIYRLSLIATKTTKKGQYLFKISEAH